MPAPFLLEQYMTWLKLSTQFVNMNNIVRVEFVQQGAQEVAVLYSVKPSGSDKTVLDNPQDVASVKGFLNTNGA